MSSQVDTDTEKTIYIAKDYRTLADRFQDSLDKTETPVVTQFPTKQKAPTRARVEGAIRKIKQDRGYGFIAGDDGIDYFFHWSAMDRQSKNFRDCLVQERVSFEAVHVVDPQTHESKYRAIKIRVE
jgi:cold shock protein